MKEYAPGVESAKLRLVDLPTTSADGVEPVAGAARSTGTDAVHASTATGDAAPAHTSIATVADRFLTKAINEHAAGHVDQTLWTWAMAQAGGDNARAKGIYLQRRATALRVTKREKRAARYAQVAQALSNAPDAGFDLAASGGDAATAPAESTETRRSIAKRNRRRTMMLAGVYGSLLVVGGLLVVLSRSDPAGKIVAANPAPRSNVLARSTPSIQPTPAATPAGAVARENASGDKYVDKVAVLEKEGNWNLVVLYAVEWTRKQPENADAWKKLSQGYVKLRQYREAQDAATKATQLAPDDFLQWQNLGQVNLDIQSPAEALKAFSHASILNDHDVVSVVQVGLLNAQLGHLPEAGVAFANALAVNPQDVQALCGAASVAQRDGRAKDAQAMMRQVTSLAARCSDPDGGASVRVIVGESARAKTTR